MTGNSSSATRWDGVPIALWWLGAVTATIFGGGPFAFAWLVSGFLMVTNCVLTDREDGRG